jgi:hypothetical protein
MPPRLWRIDVPGWSDGRLRLRSPPALGGPTLPLAQATISIRNFTESLSISDLIPNDSRSLGLPHAYPRKAGGLLRGKGITGL